MNTHVHDLSGFLPVIHIAGVPIPVYFLFTSLSFIVGILYLIKRGEARGFSRNRILDLALVIMGSGFVGSRLFHVFFEEPAYYFARPWLVFDIWSGGFVWYGGALLAGAAGFAFLYRRKEPFGPWLDLFAPVGALGYAIGRVACFCTGCCYGDLVRIPEGWFGSWAGSYLRHPTQAYAVAIEIITLTILLSLEKRRAASASGKWLGEPGQIFYTWLILHGLGRIVMESFRGDPRGPEPVGLSIATWISFALIAIAATLFVKNKR